MFGLQWMYPEDDKLTIELNIEHKEGEEAMPVEFLYTRKKEMKQVINSMQHFKNFVSQKANPHVDKDMVVLTESDDNSTAVMNERFGKAFAKYGNKIYYLHVSD